MAENSYFSENSQTRYITVDDTVASVTEDGNMTAQSKGVTYCVKLSSDDYYRKGIGEDEAYQIIVKDMESVKAAAREEIAKAKQGKYNCTEITLIVGQDKEFGNSWLSPSKHFRIEDEQILQRRDNNVMRAAAEGTVYVAGFSDDGEITEIYKIIVE